MAKNQKNHKEYVSGIVDIMAAEFRTIKTKLEETFKLYNHSVETERIWDYLLKEMNVSAQATLSEFVKNRGVIRKQRVSKNDKNDEKNDKNDKNEKNGFFIYCKKFRKGVRESNPGYNAAQITKCLGDMWKNVPSAEKEQFK